jgi:hypothetical protein
MTKNFSLASVLLKESISHLSQFSQRLKKEMNISILGGKRKLLNMVGMLPIAKYYCLIYELFQKTSKIYL